ncbi:tripartite tricarboxylate transporter TctB [Pseudomonas aeruginosa]|nr:tripartite tricarboxylate transporter TctB [Pseudomonas aeruginosa]
MSSSSDAPLVATRWVEIGLALFTAALGAIVMYGSQDIGIGWGDSGPEAGYFPFYIGLLLSAASLGNLLLALCRWRALGTLVRRPHGLSPGACGVPADRRLQWRPCRSPGSTSPPRCSSPGSCGATVAATNPTACR